LNNNKLINPKLICAFCWFVLFFNYENARSKNQNVQNYYGIHLFSSLDVTKMNFIESKSTAA